MIGIGNYVDRSDRKNKRRLLTLLHVLRKAGFDVADHINDKSDPYLYVKKPLEVFPDLQDLTFGGVRLYFRGKDLLCFMVQNKENAEPYGEPYRLDVTGMFRDFLQDAGRKESTYYVVFNLLQTLVNFFLDSLRAERVEGSTGLGSVVAADGGTDYANTVFANQGWT